MPVVLKKLRVAASCVPRNDSERAQAVPQNAMLCLSLLLFARKNAFIIRIPLTKNGIAMRQWCAALHKHAFASN